MMNYISAKETAEKWGISTRRVQVLCVEGRIPGASRLGNVWAVPKEAQKPIDGRMERSITVPLVKGYENE